MKDKKLTLKTKMSHEECEGENKKGYIHGEQKVGYILQVVYQWLTSVKRSQVGHKIMNPVLTNMRW